MGVHFPKSGCEAAAGYILPWEMFKIREPFLLLLLASGGKFRVPLNVDILILTKLYCTVPKIRIFKIELFNYDFDYFQLM